MAIARQLVRRAVTKVKPSALKRTGPISAGKVTAKAKFLTLCRRSIEEERPIHIRDADKGAFMVLDFVERRLEGPLVDVSAQFFKDNFSRCTSAVRDGVCFRLSLKGSNRAVYARRHTKYADPLDGVFAEWRDKVVEAALQDANNESVLEAIRDLGRRADQGQQNVDLMLKRLARGIARMAIGNKPFEEGDLPQGSFMLHRDAEATEEMQ
ncbi:hypothetical protein O7A70_31950 [Mesorhizobium sp. Cs1299R1N1]|uniref:hypothetical protein n=1 Tax=Mesorhizobium sp. Cs1299R1N1 TaxID=3015172 RepID=UPI00301DA7D0